MTPDKSIERVAVVTGAAQGLGYDIAAALASLGHRVALLDRADDVARSAATLQARGATAAAHCLDVTDEAAVQRTIAAIEEAWGDVGILVNGAGITGRKGAHKTAVVDMDPSDWRRVITTNVASAFLLCRACIPGMQRARWGRIVNIASQAARARTERSNAHYAASKSAVLGLSRGLAHEVASSGITVNCVAPGRIATPMTVQTGADVDAAYSAKSAVGRVGVPADVTAAVMYLTSEGSAFMTGATVDVNGGYSMN